MLLLVSMYLPALQSYVNHPSYSMSLMLPHSPSVILSLIFHVAYSPPSSSSSCNTIFNISSRLCCRHLRHYPSLMSLMLAPSVIRSVMLHVTDGAAFSSDTVLYISRRWCCFLFSLHYLIGKLTSRFHTCIGMGVISTLALLSLETLFVHAFTAVSSALIPLH